MAVYPADGLYLRPREPLALDYHKVKADGFGIPNCIIFRPKDLDTSPGKRYWVEVAGVDHLRGPAVIHYLVEFADLVPEAGTLPGEGK